MGGDNQDPWRPGGAAWLTIAAVTAVLASLSILSNLSDPRPFSVRFGPSSAYAGGMTLGYGMDSSR